MKKSIVISLLTVTILFCTALYSFAATGIVTTDTLRLRKDASVEASIIGLLSMNDKVEVLEEKNGWYKVKAEVDSEQVEGYVSADYLKVEEDVNKADEPKESEETKVEEGKTDTEENKNEQSEEKLMVKTLSKDVKIYITPVINSIVLNTLEEEKQIEVGSEVNGWSYITTGNIKGWVRTENIVEKEAPAQKEDNSSTKKTAYISGNSVNFREAANTSAKSMMKLLKNTQVKVLSEDNGWTKIELNGKVGYVSSSYVSDKKVAVTSRSSTTTKKTTTTNTKAAKTATTSEVTETSVSKGSATGSEIVAFAKKYLGYKYVSGGSTPSKGFDCSGFTTYVYKHFGYSISRTSSAQASNGKAVNKSSLQAGDIICFARRSGSKKIGHVGIYIGGGKFIHAANSRKGVIISNVSGDGFYYVCARRIV